LQGGACVEELEGGHGLCPVKRKKESSFLKKRSKKLLTVWPGAAGDRIPEGVKIDAGAERGNAAGPATAVMRPWRLDCHRAVIIRS